MLGPLLSATWTQVKENFWRRDAFIVEDDEESEADGSGYGSEALEEGERPKGNIPLEVSASRVVFPMEWVVSK